MGTNRIATLLLLLGLALLGYAFVPGYGPQYTAFEETRIVLADELPDQPVTDVHYFKMGSADPIALRFQQAPDEATITVDLARVAAVKPFYKLEVTRKDGSVRAYDLQVLEKRIGLLAAVGALLTILSAPVVMIQTSPLQTRVGKSKKLVPVTGWTYLLLEQGTGLSLARLQLLLLFVPAATVYFALAVPLHEFPYMPDSVWQLLGIGGATAALSSLITPGGSSKSNTTPPTDGTAQPAPAQSSPSLQATAEAAAAAMTAPDTVQVVYTAPAAPADRPETIEVPPPRLTDLFEEVNGYGDFSRYQSLVMCAVTSAVFFVSFFDTWTVPAVPSQVLQLLGTSLAVYLGVKGIRLVKKSDAA